MKCPKCHFENPDNTTFCGKCANRLDSLEDTLEDRTETIDFKPLRLKTGSTLAGRYRIIEELGFGGMGRIYKAIDKEIGERIAVKLLRPEIAANRKLIERFQNELITTRKIAHRYVCRMYDLGRDGETRFITMEYVSGEDLRKSLTRMGPLMARKAVSLGIQICQGLSEAHRRGVIHRDLKPGNNMIDMEGNIRIMDFGIALSQETKDLTESGVVIGTPKYFSPEQVEGKVLDPRSDIYSFGVILYEMVTGHVPFEGDTTLVVAYKHMSETPRNPREFNAQLPKELSQLILKCLNKNPAKRYQSTEEICAALTKIKEDLPTSETTVSKTKFEELSQKKSFRSRPKFVRALGILFLSVFILASAFIVYDQFLKTRGSDGASPMSVDWVNSVVILPFEHLNPQPGQENLWISFTEAIIRKLNKFQELKVISLSSALVYKDSDKGLSEIGRDLDVKNVLSGIISTLADEVRVTLKRDQIADSPFTGEATYSGNPENMSELEDEVAKSLAKYLRLARVDERYESLSSPGSANTAANSYYQDGRANELEYYRTGEESDFLNSAENYTQAVSADPGFALAYWRLGNLHEARYNTKDGEEADLSRMSGFFEKAHEVDRYSAEANVGMGWYFFYQDDFDSAYQFFKLGYELDPNNAEINFLMGSFFKSLGLFEYAITHYDRGLELDPFPLDFSIWHGLRSKCYAYTGRCETGAQYLENAIQHNPDPWLLLEYVIQLVSLKRYSEAEEQIARAEESLGTSKKLDEDIRHTKAVLFAVLDEREKALALIEDEDDTYRHLITSIYAVLGLKTHALRNIRIGIEEGFQKTRETLYSYPFLLNVPFYDSLRGDAQFQNILRLEKEKYEAKRKKYGDL